MRNFHTNTNDSLQTRMIINKAQKLPPKQWSATPNAILSMAKDLCNNCQETIVIRWRYWGGWQTIITTGEGRSERDHHASCISCNRTRSAVRRDSAESPTLANALAVRLSFSAKLLLFVLLLFYNLFCLLLLLFSKLSSLLLLLLWYFLITIIIDR